MRKSGSSLFELLIIIGVLALLFEIGLTGMELLDHKTAGQANSLGLDRVVERLRADARRGVTRDGEQIIAGGHRWAVVSGALQRDGLTQIAGTWTVTPGEQDVLTLVLRAPGLHARVIRLWTQP